MSRAARLFELVQSLRRRRLLVTAAELGEELQVSVRTVYRDVAALAACGVPVMGEPGLGYMLRNDQFLPPFKFSEDEIDAVLLGLRWVQRRADSILARAAEDALVKITAALPAESRRAADVPAVFIGPDKPLPHGAVGVGQFRTAVRKALKTHILYRDAQGRETERSIWPIGLAFMEEARLVVAWCELRRQFRHFRLDRMARAQLGEPYPESRAVLLRRWQAEIEAEQMTADNICQR